MSKPKTPSSSRKAIKKPTIGLGVKKTVCAEDKAAASLPNEANADIPTELKKKELIEKIVTITDLKPRDVRPIAEAMLEVLGKTLAEGRELNLQPLGKVRIQKARENGAARILTCKIRQNRETDPGKPQD